MIADIPRNDVFDVLSYTFGPIFNIAIQLALTALMVFLAMMLYALIKYRLIPPSVKKLEAAKIRFRLFSFLRWIIYDAIDRARNGENFEEYGFTIYCGRQGGGKTVSMVDYLARMHKRFPKAFIVTNFKFQYATHTMESWEDFMEIRNGTDGVIFAIDEIHSEYSNSAWKDFPEALLSEISQQRKQRVKIVATSQVYGRVVKQIREQCFSVVQCKTIAGRWTRCREYDAAEYEMFENSAKKKDQLRSIRRWSFVQGPGLRASFDTYEKIERLRKMEFIARNER